MSLCFHFRTPLDHSIFRAVHFCTVLLDLRPYCMCVSLGEDAKRDASQLLWRIVSLVADVCVQ